MPPKKGTKPPPKNNDEKKTGKKESKGASAVKVRHILCEKQVCNLQNSLTCYVKRLKGQRWLDLIYLLNNY